MHKELKDLEKTRSHTGEVGRWEGHRPYRLLCRGVAFHDFLWQPPDSVQQCFAQRHYQLDWTLRHGKKTKTDSAVMSCQTTCVKLKVTLAQREARKKMMEGRRRRDEEKFCERDKTRLMSSFAAAAVRPDV